MPKTKAIAPKVISKEELQAKSGLALLYSFLVMFAASALVVYLANLLFPTSVVLGTHEISLWWAIYHSVLVLTLICTFVIPLVYYHEWKRGQMYTPKEWMLAYFVVNTLAVYGLTRYAGNLGLGIAHWWIAPLLGAALDWAQGMVMMALNKVIGN